MHVRMGAVQRFEGGTQRGVHFFGLIGHKGV